MTTSIITRTAVSGALLALLAGCGGAGPGAQFDESTAPLTSTNGRSMNGRSMNGRSMNGTDLTNLYVTSVALSPIAVGSIVVKDAVLTGTTFSSAKAALSGVAFKGAVFTATLSDGTTIPLTVASIAALPAPNADVTGYALTYATSTGAQQLCGTEPDGSPILAVPTMGTWNFAQGVTGGGSWTSSTRALTFACRHAAIAKCVELGYRPWITSGTNMKAYWVTCTRVLRADYCGDGTSYTVDGTVIDIYDNLKVLIDDSPTWPAEAQWHQNGAACITPGTFDRFTMAGFAPPPCYAKRTAAATTCGTGGFSVINGNQTLIIDRYKQ